MTETPSEPPDQSSHDAFPDLAAPDAGTRVAMGCLAIPFAAFAGLIVLAVTKSLDGRGWVEQLVRLVFLELALAVGLVSATLLIGALAAPRWLSLALTAACQKVVLVILLTIAFLVAAALFMVFVVPVLVRFGVMR